MGVRCVGAKGYDGGKGRSLAAGLLIKAVDVGGALALRHSLLNIGGGCLHAAVIDGGGDAHLFQLLLILDQAQLVHTEGSIAVAHAGIQVHQGQKEAGGPLFIDPQIGLGVHLLG